MDKEAADVKQLQEAAKAPQYTNEERVKAWQGVSLQLAQELANKLGGTHKEWLAWATGNGPKPKGRKERKRGH
jgi:hypothetical protein